MEFLFSESTTGLPVDFTVFVQATHAVLPVPSLTLYIPSPHTRPPSGPIQSMLATVVTGDELMSIYLDTLGGAALRRRGNPHRCLGINLRGCCYCYCLCYILCL